MHRCRELLRPLGASTRTQFSADYTITMSGFDLRQGHPGLDERAIDRKVLVREQGFHGRMLDQLGHELLEHVALLKPVPVLGEDRWVPDWIIWRQSHKPAEE